MDNVQRVLLVFRMVFVLDYITNLLTMSQNFNRIRVKIVKQYVRAKSMGFKVHEIYIYI